MSERKRLGSIGESLACRYLRSRRYRIIERNYSTAFGEMDIIAVDGDVLAFIEVKTRRSDSHGLPEEAIDRKKRYRLVRLAQCYIKNKGLYEKKARFDVVSIIKPGRFGKKRIALIKNAFLIED